ncbi:MAG: hypothetical protein FWC55_06535 [Firmicutes bacterium]|nr:hypothetical protein [Bacillota bacterium]
MTVAVALLIAHGISATAACAFSVPPTPVTAKTERIIAKTRTNAEVFSNMSFFLNMAFLNMAFFNMVIVPLIQMWLSSP